MDGTLIQAWASHKSFVPKDGSNDDANSGGPSGRNAQADWKGKRRSNDTHASTTDPDARLFRKSHNTAAVLAYQGHVLMENRSGLVVGALVTHADGMGERAAALAMLDTLPGRTPRRWLRTKPTTRATSSTLAASDASRRTWPATTRAIGGSAIDGRTTRHHGYAISQTIRKRIEEHFGWGKTVGRIRQTVYRGLRRVDQHFKLDDDRQQHRANGPNTGRDAAWSNAMNRCNEPKRGNALAKTKCRGRSRPDRRVEIGPRRWSSTGCGGSSRRISTAC